MTITLHANGEPLFLLILLVVWSDGDPLFLPSSATTHWSANGDGSALTTSKASSPIYLMMILT